MNFHKPRDTIYPHYFLNMADILQQRPTL